MRERKRVLPPQPTSLDRFIGWLNPSAGLRRHKARTVLAATGGYTGGRRDRRATKNWMTSGGSADADILPDLPLLRERSRDLVRNNPIGRSAVSTKSTYTIGGGLIVKPVINGELLGLKDDEAKIWEKKAKAEFDLACKTLDWTRVQDFREQQVTAFWAMLESGDVFPIRRYRKDAGDTYGAKLQLIEADRVSNPDKRIDTDRLVSGIEHDQNGAPVAVHVSDSHPGNLRAKQLNWRRVPMRYRDGRRIVHHLFLRERIDQTRGVPILAPVIEEIKSIFDYSEAEVRAAVTSAYFTVFVTSEIGDSDSSSVQSADKRSEDTGEVTLGSGAIIDLDEGESIEIADPKRPNDSFEGFINAVMREIGMALEIPFEILVKHFTASYSASRAALEMAYQVFNRDRNFFARKFCQPVYEWVIEEAVLIGRLDAPGFFADPLIRQAWLGTEWRGPGRMSLDPGKDSKADKSDVELGVKTREQIIAERIGSGDVDITTTQLAREESARVAGKLAKPIDHPPAV